MKRSSASDVILFGWFLKDLVMSRSYLFSDLFAAEKPQPPPPPLWNTKESPCAIFKQNWFHSKKAFNPAWYYNSSHGIRGDWRFYLVRPGIPHTAPRMSNQTPVPCFRVALMNCRGNGLVVVTVQICTAPCPGSGWGKAHSPHSAVLCISSWMGVDNRPVIQLLLSSTDPN